LKGSPVWSASEYNGAAVDHQNSFFVFAIFWHIGCFLAATTHLLIFSIIVLLVLAVKNMGQR
jgi:hypothetical protein